MNAKEYTEMRKIVNKVEKGEQISLDEAVRYALLLEKSGISEALTACQKVLRNEAAERKVTYDDALGSVTVYEPFVKAIREDDFKRDKPEEYANIMSRKAEKLHLNLDDLTKEDIEQYTYYKRGTARVKVSLA